MTLGDVEVVGIVRLPFDLVDDPSTDALVLAPPGEWVERLPDGATIGTIALLHLDDPAAAADVVSELSRLVEEGQVEETGDVLRSAQRAAELQRNALLIAAATVAVTALLAIGQAVTRHLAPRREDAHVLAAIGLTAAERRRAGLYAILPALVAGAFGGVALAVVASPLLPLGIARRADPDGGVHADWQVLLGGLVIAIVATSVCAAVAVRRWDRGPARAVTERRPATIARVAAALGLRPVPSAGSHLALASGRGRARLPVLPTLAGLAAIVAVVVGSLAVRSSLIGLLGDADRFGQPWDVTVDADPAEQREVGLRLAADPRVAGVDVVHKGELNLAAADGSVRQVGSTGLEGLTGPMRLAVLDGRSPFAAGRDRRRHHHDAGARSVRRRRGDDQRSVRRAPGRGGRARHRATRCSTSIRTRGWSSRSRRSTSCAANV